MGRIAGTAGVLSGLARLLGNCSRRWRDEEEEEETDCTPFWVKSPAEDVAEEIKSDVPREFELATSLKDNGNDYFAKGEIEEAINIWGRALNALTGKCEDDMVRDLRATLFSNLALGNMRTRRWRQALEYCEATLEDQPKHQKALYRKADCLAELGMWVEAEKAIIQVENFGQEGVRLASQKREIWKKKRKAADDQQKKMWGVALAKEQACNALQTASADSSVKKPKRDVRPAWIAPKIEQATVFDLRRKGTEWDEQADFNDRVWKTGLGRDPVALYYKQALPLTLVAAAALSNLDVESTFTLHCFLDGITAPFAEPHDWGLVLRRFPHVRKLMVVFIDISLGAGSDSKDISIPRNQISGALEEARAGDRCVHSVRFLGSYKEFRERTLQIPGIVLPRLAIWADIPVFGKSNEEFNTRLEALRMIAADNVPLVVTQESEIPEIGGQFGGPWVSASATQSMAILEIGFGAKAINGWHWNRFVIPLDQTERGILAAHAIVGVVRLKKATPARTTIDGIKELLQQNELETVSLSRVACLGKPSESDAQAFKMRCDAFSKYLQREGRPIGPDAPEDEKQRQMLEFQRFCETIPGSASIQRV